MSTTQLQFVGSYEVFDNGIPFGIHDVRIETNPTGGSIETIQGATVTTKLMPGGFPAELSMNREQAFEALRHVQDRNKSIADAFGTDLQPRPQGIQIQGVIAFARPSWVSVVGCPCNGGASSVTSGSPSVAKLAFVLRDGWLTVSTLGEDGTWHSDSEKAKEALEGLTVTQVIEVIGKIMMTVELSWWMWGLILLCGTVTGGGGAILCALGLIALELITIGTIIATIEEVTGTPAILASYNNAKTQYAAHQFGSTKTALQTARADMNELLLDAEFPHAGLGLYLSTVVPPQS